MLVVDDEPLVRRALRRELGASYLVLEASGPTDALALVERHAGKLVAVVSDLAMREGRDAGLALLTEVAGRHPQMARILVSGTLGGSRVRDGVVHATIAKPWRRGEIAAAIERARAG